jgi:hypothetical protein
MKQLSPSPEAAAAALGMSMENAIRYLQKRRAEEGRSMGTVPFFSANRQSGDTTTRQAKR